MPNTGNVGLEVPLTGTLVGTWGSAAINPDMIAIDGLLGGVVSIAVTGGNLTLDAPVGKSIAATAGPVQSQNRVLKFSGVLASDETVTLPLPGKYVVKNSCTGAFNLIMRAVAPGNVVAIPPGETVEIWNDGTDVEFSNLGRMGHIEMWAGLSAMPAWVAACTVRPYLLCDATAFNFSDFPALGARLGGTFGGNGITTGAPPDLRGRVPLAYDGTGTRITVAGCGLNGQTLGASLDAQTVTLTRANLPNTSISVTINDPGHSHSYFNITGAAFTLAGGANAGPVATPTSSATTGITASFNLNGGVSQTTVNNVQPSLVTGIWVIKT